VFFLIWVSSVFCLNLSDANWWVMYLYVFDALVLLYFKLRQSSVAQACISQGWMTRHWHVQF
jgi:hypothetical protein